MAEQNKFLRELKDALHHLNSVKVISEPSEPVSKEENSIKPAPPGEADITEAVPKTTSLIEPGTVRNVSAQILAGGVSGSSNSTGRVRVPPIFVQTTSPCTSASTTPQHLSPAKSVCSTSSCTKSIKQQTGGSEMLPPLSEEHVISPSSVLLVTKAHAAISKQNVNQIRNCFTTRSAAPTVAPKPLNGISMPNKKPIGMIKNRRMRAVHDDLYRELNNVLQRRTEQFTGSTPRRTGSFNHHSGDMSNIKISSASTPDMRIERCASSPPECSVSVDNIPVRQAFPSDLDITANHYQSVVLPVPSITEMSASETDNDYMDIDMVQRKEPRKIPTPPPLPPIPPPPPLPRHFNFKSLPQLHVTTADGKMANKPNSSLNIYPKHKRNKSETYMKANTVLPILKNSQSTSHIYEVQEQTCDITGIDCTSGIDDQYSSSIEGNQYSMYSRKKSPSLRLASPNGQELSSSDISKTSDCSSSITTNIIPSSEHLACPEVVVTELTENVAALNRWDSGAPESTGCLTSSDISSAASDSTLSTGHVTDDPSAPSSSVNYLVGNIPGMGYLNPDMYPHPLNLHSDVSLTTITSCDNSVNEDITKNSSMLCSSFEHVPLHRASIPSNHRNPNVTVLLPEDDTGQDRRHVLTGTSCKNVQSFAGASTLEGQQKWMQANAPMFVKVIPSVPDLKIVKNESEEKQHGGAPADSKTNSLDRHLETHTKKQANGNFDTNKIYATYPPPKSGKHVNGDEDVITSLLIQHSGERIPPDGAESLSSLHHSLGLQHCVGHTLTVPQPTSFHSYGGSQLLAEPPPDWDKSGSGYNLCGKPTSIYGKDFTARAVYEEQHPNNKQTYYTGAMTSDGAKDTGGFYRHRYPHSDSSLRDLDTVPFYRTNSASTQEPTDLSIHETSSPDERRGLFRKKLSSASEKESQRHLLYHTWSSMAAKRQQEKSSKLKVPSWKRFVRQNKTDDDSDSSSSFGRGIKPRLMRNASNASSSADCSLHGEAGVYKKRDRSQSLHTSLESSQSVHTYVPEVQEHPSDADTESLYQDLDAYERSLFQYVKRTADMSERSADIRSLYWQQLDSVSCKGGPGARRTPHDASLLHRLVCCFVCPGRHHQHPNAAMLAARAAQQNQHRQQNRQQHLARHRHTYAAPKGKCYKEIYS